MKVLTVVGARPQFIKAFVVSRELKKENHEEVLLHTGQHYDLELSDIFFEELGMSEPDYNLGVGSGKHGEQTAEMMKGIEEVIEEEKPDFTLLYGDTNSTLAAAIVGAKTDTKLAHVEAGLRSNNWDMPEEVNRVLTDRASGILFVPSEQAKENLKSEGITEGVYNVGDVMYDALLWGREISREESNIIAELGLEGNEFILSTVHRAANTDNPDRLKEIIEGLSNASYPVILPIHPRTKKCMREHRLWEGDKKKIKIVDPVGYLDFVRLMDTANIIATDSGGIQKEAFFLDTPCVTLRDETEWVETIESGWNKLVNAKASEITRALDRKWELPSEKPTPYGDGNATEKIVEVLESAR